MLKNKEINDLVSKGHTFEVVYISHSSNTSTTTVALKVSPLIRLTIFNNLQTRVFIGDTSYLVEDRFHFMQCYHCQQIGHVSTDCHSKKESPTCFYCMGNHKSKDCTKKRSTTEHCCAKCFKSSVPGEKDGYKSHNAASTECPSFIREMKKVSNNTEYLSKNIL